MKSLSSLVLDMYPAVFFQMVVIANIWRWASCRDLTLEPGHLEPFGSGRPVFPLEEIDGFPDPKTFIQDYVFSLKPVKMRGAAKMSPAYSLWTDEYFLSKDEPTDNKVTVETAKKESRQQEILQLSFKDFIRSYNATERYMVNAVPNFLGQDVIMPCPLQCQDLISENLVDNVMWYSNGGTKSVVHTDSVDNLNCLFRGEKELFMIDPSKYGDKVDMDRPEGSYSAVDVDSVDYRKYPGLAEVEFYHVNLTAGDCLYIPYRWIHQVRSYGSNIAVNLWWNHHHNVDIDLGRCNDVCDRDLTLDKLEFLGFGELTDSIDAIKDHINAWLGVDKKIEFDTFLKAAVGEDADLFENTPDVGEGYKIHARRMFYTVDSNKDGMVTQDELLETSTEAWVKLQKLWIAFDVMLEKIYDDIFPEDDDEEEDLQDAKDEL